MKTVKHVGRIVSLLVALSLGADWRSAQWLHDGRSLRLVER